MKKTSLIIALLALSLTVFAGGKKKYQEAMGKTLAKMSQCQSPDDFIALGNEFERIAVAEEKEWLPRYYQVYTYVIASFMEQEPEVKDGLLDKVELVLEELEDMEPKEAEIHALKGQYLTARLVVNPDVRGPQYSMLAEMAIGKALRLDGSNPRARYMDLSFKIGKTKYFGGSTDQFCAEASELLADWEKMQSGDALAPSWGKNQLEGIVAECNGNNQ